MDITARMEILVMIAVVLAVSLALLQPTIRLAFRLGIVDRPDAGRKLHARATAYLGGAILWLCLLLSLAVSVRLGAGPSLLAVGAGCTLLFGLGVVDDARNLSPKVKLVGQGLAVAILIAGLHPELRHGSLESWALWGLVFVFCVGAVNAFNLVDGLDGLALGLGLLTVTPYFLLAWGRSDLVGTAVALGFAAGATGMLRGNLHPARIFLGDAGSLLIGGTVVALALAAMPHRGELTVGQFEMLAPLAVGVPVIDMLAVMLLRLRRGLPLFQGDRNHLHHRLLRLGLPHEAVVGTIHAAMAMVLLFQILLWKIHASWWWMLALLPGWILAYAVLGRLERRAARLVHENATATERAVHVH